MGHTYTVRGRTFCLGSGTSPNHSELCSDLVHVRCQECGREVAITKHGLISHHGPTSKDRKTFAAGAAVEVQREVGAAWERATYGGSVTDMLGWHNVELDPSSRPRQIDSMTGMEQADRNDRTYLTHRMIVPTQRLRAPKETYRE